MNPNSAPVHQFVERENYHFRENIFQRHQGIDGMLRANYERRARDKGAAVANRQLSELDKRLTLPGACFSAAMDDDAIRSLAKTRAGQCEELHTAIMKNTGGDISASTHGVCEFVERNAVRFPLKIAKKDTADDIARKSVAALARVCCDRWWRRQLRKVTGRQVEAQLRALGFVQRKKSAYISDWAYQRWRSAQRRNAETLGRLEAVNEEGEAVALMDCIESSIANPSNRRDELMVRQRGYQEVAEGLGLDGWFFTLTTPSRFHAVHEWGGRNAKYNGATPRDAMDWLTDTWALIRSAWQKAGIKTFGFRVVEPHHDGTPHLHMILYFNAEDTAKAKAIFGRYALADSPDEPGAIDNRWDAIYMDPAKGGPAAYMAKYIAKNIDGYAVGWDEEAEVPAEQGASRVKAWMSLWGIRQFQPIGSVSVTVWRELRRRREPLEQYEPQQLEALRTAADSNDWAEFVKLMGGAFVSRDAQTVRACYLESEEQPNRYGEAIKRLIGVWLQPVGRAIGRVLATREHVWEIRERAEAREQVAAQPPPLDLCQ